MPISSMSEDYTKAHWLLVKEVIDTAVEKAGFLSRAAWVDPSKDVIHAKIIKNIYDCEVIICDLSNLNPNVMLETGIRLSTKKPIIIITDGVTKPPFDINPIEYIEYPKNLNYKETILFIDELSEKISSTANSYREGTYIPFMHHYKYDIVAPESRLITEDQYIEKEIKEIKNILYNLTNNKNKSMTKDKFETEVMFIVSMRDDIEELNSDLNILLPNLQIEMETICRNNKVDNKDIKYTLRGNNIRYDEIIKIQKIFELYDGVRVK
ncbi:hypothetical protein [Gluconobacter wancherniae]|uniref:hypothetical protein n=1 Tax=Gluconobacter wancherniae TaxID=1307955 RepID=UPI001B8CB35E|nr:hypothetical protein [Gluconobacter wancherniae]MBS1088156.1 hypothetical protein [Gluconobacter wancherniae]